MSEKSPLFPVPIPVIGLCGEVASGKTMFGVTICPGPETLVIDTEQSSASYEGIGFERHDLPLEMVQKFPKGYRPVDVFLHFVSIVKALPPGKFRVVMLDVIEDVETGLCDWVWENPLHFRRTHNTYVKSSGIYWGDVKTQWKMVLNVLASKCETFVFTAHMRQKWIGNAPTKIREPKGKETLMELASLYLLMQRSKDPSGKLPDAPSAIVMKSRQGHTTVSASGEIITQPLLPARLPVATPHALRQYLSQPRVGVLGAAEYAPEHQMTQAEMLETQLEIARANEATARLQLEAATAGRPQEPLTGSATTPEAEEAPPPSPEPDPAPEPAPEKPKRGRKPKATEQAPEPAPETNGEYGIHATEERFHRARILHGSIKQGLLVRSTFTGQPVSQLVASILKHYSADSPDLLRLEELEEIDDRIATENMELRKQETANQEKPF
jgi:hypothetical protein